MCVHPWAGSEKTDSCPTALQTLTRAHYPTGSKDGVVISTSTAPTTLNPTHTRTQVHTHRHTQVHTRTHKLCPLPDILVGDDEGFAERLRRVEPDGRVLLGRRGRLARDGGGAHVEGAGDGGEEGLVRGVRPQTCGGGGRGTDIGVSRTEAPRCRKTGCFPELHGNFRIFTFLNLLNLLLPFLCALFVLG